MVRIFGIDVPSASSEETSRMRDLIDKAELRFQELPEEDQMLTLLSQQISWVYGNYDDERDKDEIARRLIADSHGPKFAERVLSDPELRKKVGLDRPPRPQDQSVIAKTVMLDE